MKDVATVLGILLLNFLILLAALQYFQIRPRRAALASASEAAALKVLNKPISAYAPGVRLPTGYPCRSRSDCASDRCFKRLETEPEGKCF